MTTIDFADFTWFSPKPKGSQMAITVPNLTCLNFNAKAMIKMPVQIQIGISEDAKTIGICEKPGTGYKIPKSGTVKDKDLVDFLVSHGVRLPAKYELQPAANGWIANLMESRPPKVTGNSRKPRISKITADKLIKEIESV